MNITEYISMCTTYDGCILFENKLSDYFSQLMYNDPKQKRKYGLLLRFVYNIKVMHDKSYNCNICDIKQLINGIIFFENIVQHPTMIYFIKILKFMSRTYINKTISGMLLCLIHHFDLFDLRIDNELHTSWKDMTKQYKTIICIVDEYDDFLIKFIQSCISSVKQLPLICEK